MELIPAILFRKFAFGALQKCVENNRFFMVRELDVITISCQFLSSSFISLILSMKTFLKLLLI